MVIYHISIVLPKRPGALSAKWKSKQELPSNVPTREPVGLVCVLYALSKAMLIFEMKICCFPMNWSVLCNSLLQLFWIFFTFFYLTVSSCLPGSGNFLSLSRVIRTSTQSIKLSDLSNIWTTIQGLHFPIADRVTNFNWLGSCSI